MKRLLCLLGRHDWRNWGKGEPIIVGREFVIGTRYPQRRCDRCHCIKDVA